MLVSLGIQCTVSVSYLCQLGACRYAAPQVSLQLLAGCVQAGCIGEHSGLRIGAAGSTQGMRFARPVNSRAVLPMEGV